MESNSNSAGVCSCKHHKAMPTLVVLFGLVFLLGYLNILTTAAVNIIWPILVIVAGVSKLSDGACKCCKK